MYNIASVFINLNTRTKCFIEPSMILNKIDWYSPQYYHMQFSERRMHKYLHNKHGWYIMQSCHSQLDVCVVYRAWLIADAKSTHLPPSESPIRRPAII